MAEKATRFVHDENPVHDDGMPAYGNAFIIQGHIYPHETLSGGNGVLADGSPEFPEKVMGSWICRGWFIGDGSHTESGAWVISTQLYDFGAGTGRDTLVSEGVKGAVKQKTFQRAVIGGTGSYKGSEGIAHQKLLGFNRAEGVNLRFKIRITND